MVPGANFLRELPIFLFCFEMVVTMWDGVTKNHQHKRDFICFIQSKEQQDLPGGKSMLFHLLGKKQSLREVFPD
jgi:hypothetical protein